MTCSFCDGTEGPIIVAVEARDLENLISRAQECAEDLQVEVAKTIPGNDHIAERHRKRATEASRWLLSALPALKSKYGVDDV
ncbi:hypothetical protein PXK56_17765 [Phaeobacter gallaeciensis]|uniref:hypothetical protein n=1 Tax=Phaeobacter gallaeciensis TaxID=60890 RepID=UPI0023800E74|nr:hypothetical protein [Phaeobacter gallaeciensis]MDE4297036.1 hypothetical protein [Phaeobacter gallaeciensis]